MSGAGSGNGRIEEVAAGDSAQGEAASAPAPPQRQAPASFPPPPPRASSVLSLASARAAGGIPCLFARGLPQLHAAAASAAGRSRAEAGGDGWW